MNFAGVFPILPTPFDDDQRVDLESYGRMVRFMGDAGVAGVTILGVLGEANRLVDSERAEIIEVAVEAAGGRFPVVVGSSHSGTKATVALSAMARERGAAAVMVTPHREATPNEARLFEHFADIGREVDLPIVLQDHPGSTDVHMSLDLVLRMVDEIEQIECVKQEALPSPGRVVALIGGMRSRRVPILTGLGALYGAFELASGADGFMTGFAFPEVLMAMVAANAAGNPDEVWRIYADYLPLMVFESQPGVAIRKELFRMRGMIRSNVVRKPGVSIGGSARAQLQDVVRRVVGDANIGTPISV